MWNLQIPFSSCTGAVASVKDIANPIQLSKKVLEETPHCLLSGEGASKFAKRIGIPIIDDPKKLIVQESALKAKLDNNVSFENNVKTYFNDIIESKDLRELEEIASKMAKSGEFDRGRGSVGHDTVGAVAFDSFGNIACATSTGSLNSYFLYRVSRWSMEK